METKPPQDYLPRIIAIALIATLLAYALIN
jgi:hypothetical protein